MHISVTRPSELGPAEIAAWHSMQQRTACLAHPFLGPEFAVAIGLFRPEARVAVLADGPEVAGFFTFERRRLGVGVPIGAGLNNRQGVVHAPAAEWDPAGILRACKLSVWQFDNLAEGQRPFERYAAAAIPAAQIDLTGGFAAYREKLRAASPEFMKELGRKARKLEREAGRLHHVTDSRNPAGLRALMDWKSDQCRRNGWFNAFERPWMVHVVDHLFSTRGNGFSSLLSLLYAGENLIAAQFALRSGDVAAGWFTAYDPRFGKYSPGLIQSMKMAEEYAAAGVRSIDLGSTAGAFKDKLKNQDVLVNRGMVTTGPWGGRAHQARRALTGWAGRRIGQHPPLFHAADLLLRHYGRIG